MPAHDKMNRQRIERCLKRSAAPVLGTEGQGLAGGQRRGGTRAGELVRAFQTLARKPRWRGARPATHATEARFVAANLPAGASTTVSVEVSVATAAGALHWPTSHACELVCCCAIWHRDPHRCRPALLGSERPARRHRCAARTAGARFCRRGVAAPSPRLRLPARRPSWSAGPRRRGDVAVHALAASQRLCLAAETTGALMLTREQLDWLPAGLPWQR